MLWIGAEEKGIEVNLDYDEHTPSYLVFDSDRIRQIILSLLLNALKFTFEGMISIHVEFLEQQQQLRVKVRDTGIGIPE